MQEERKSAGDRALERIGEEYLQLVEKRRKDKKKSQDI
jgi:hypothetical protein